MLKPTKIPTQNVFGSKQIPSLRSSHHFTKCSDSFFELRKLGFFSKRLMERKRLKLGMIWDVFLIKSAKSSYKLFPKPELTVTSSKG